MFEKIKELFKKIIDLANNPIVVEEKILVDTPKVKTTKKPKKKTSKKKKN